MKSYGGTIGAPAENTTLITHIILVHCLRYISFLFPFISFVKCVSGGGGIIVSLKNTFYFPFRRNILTFIKAYKIR